ncbi:MAG: diguanylate cyclase [Firmicutes bacterium]|nr:diguanylate cyclase [Bacillota bacterium]
MKKIFICSFAILLIMALFSIPVHGLDENIAWTDSELEFMKKHPVINLGVDPRFVPFEFIDEDEEYKGIATDYLALISKKTGLEFVVRKGLTWPEAYDLALKRELDALPAVGSTPERERYFLLSEPYYYFKRVIATRDTDTHISGMSNLEGYAVAVQRNSSHHSYLLGYKNINLSLYDTVETALTAVATGEETAFIGNLATTNYLIRTNGLTNLRFVSFEAEKQQALHFAARKDWPELVTIVNKAIASITEKEKADINKKWVDLDTHFDYGPIIRIAAIIGSLFSIVFMVSSFWIVRLRKEIHRREKVQSDLERTKSKVEESNDKLKKANEELAKISMVDGLTGISNRRYFDSFLEKVWGINARENFPLALVMIDIDYFKEYNDTYGHLAGDQCLKTIAGVIDNTAKRQGDFAARFGGEEFAVLLSNTYEEGAMALAEKIRVKTMNTAIRIDDKDTYVTISLGVAVQVTNESISPKQLIHEADLALYRAKEEGRNRVVKA